MTMNMNTKTKRMNLFFAIIVDRKWSMFSVYNLHWKELLKLISFRDLRASDVVNMITNSTLYVLIVQNDMTIT
jgi:hypothetical protein